MASSVLVPPLQGLALPSGPPPPPCTPLGVSPLTPSFLGPGLAVVVFLPVDSHPYSPPDCQLPQEGPLAPQRPHPCLSHLPCLSCARAWEAPSCPPPSLLGPEGRLTLIQAQEDLACPEGARALSVQATMPWLRGTVLGHLEEGDGDGRTVAACPHSSASGFQCVEFHDSVMES